ncbi:MAG: Flp family type IVb pilin [Promethearchaeota archaeon]
MKFKKKIRKFYKRIKEFLSDERGGNLIEYALLIGFALFLFFLIVSVITNMLDWVLGQSNDFFELVEDIGK